MGRLTFDQADGPISLGLFESVAEIIVVDVPTESEYTGAVDSRTPVGEGDHGRSAKVREDGLNMTPLFSAVGKEGVAFFKRR